MFQCRALWPSALAPGHRNPLLSSATRFHITVRPRDHMHADEFAFDRFDGLAPASVAAFTAATSPTTTAVTRALPTWTIGPDEFDVRRFEHGVGALDKGDQAARFDQSDCLLCHNNYVNCVSTAGFMLLVRLCRMCFQKSFHFARHHQFFIGRNHQHFHPRLGGADLASCALTAAFLSGSSTIPS